MLVTLSPLWQFIGLLAVHWVGDFVLQSHWMATTKSKHLGALSSHVGVYTVVLLAGSAVIFGLNSWLAVLLFATSNGVLHFVTDFVTIRISARLWEQQSWHDFFVIIGMDQLIHQLTLGATLWLILA